MRLALFTGHYRTDRAWTGELLHQAQERLARWRAATSAQAGPTAEGTVATLRDRLADDLDTPSALAAVDAWVADALRQPGTDADAPALIRTAVDALLGVAL
jgi:L-cysteine:1D-myo-inositol 2-amino-2-deoxy-alpha-D-glucopyranoside ligase